MGCFAMTETGHGSNVQRSAPPRRTTPRPRSSSSHTPDDQSRKDYIGNAAQHAELAVVFAQLEVGGERRQGVHAFVVPLREDGEVLPGRPDRGRRPQDGPQRRRQRPDLVRRRAGAAASLLDRFADVSPRRRLLEPHRQPQPALLHDARHPGPGPGLRRRRRHQRGEGGARRSRRSTPAAGASSRRPPDRRRSCCSTTACTSAGCCRCWRRPTRCTSPRRSWPASCTTCSPGATDDEHGPPRARVAGGRHQGARHLARDPHHPGVPRGVRRRGLPLGQPVRRAQGRHRRLHDVRGRQPRAAAARREGAAHRLRQRVRGPRPARHGPVRRRRSRSRR